MSGLFRAVTPRSFPVKLGDLTFHATGWKLSCVRQYAQQNGVQGACYVTNSGARTKQLVLDGGFFCLERPYEVILPLDAASREKTRFSFTLRDMRFSMAEIVGYSIAEKAMDGVFALSDDADRPQRIDLCAAGDRGGDRKHMIQLVLMGKNSKTQISSGIASFTLDKEMYTPYSQLTAAAYGAFR